MPFHDAIPDEQKFMRSMPARPWNIGVDDPERTGDATIARIPLSRGGLATSGDARRYILWRGKRLGHILSPKTGWPIDGATFAYLQGPGAREFLEAEGAQFRIV